VDDLVGVERGLVYEPLLARRAVADLDRYVGCGFERFFDEHPLDLKRVLPLVGEHSLHELSLLLFFRSAHDGLFDVLERGDFLPYVLDLVHHSSVLLPAMASPPFGIPSHP